MKKIIACFLSVLILTSCVETALVGIGATAMVATREKSVKDTVKDTVISAKIDKELLAYSIKTPTNYVGVMVNEGRVLLTGTIRDIEKGKKANEIAWQTKGVKEVIDEIEIDKDALKASDFFGSIHDSYITTKIKTKLVFYRDINSSDYKIKTENNIVYLLGTANSNGELRAVLKIISKTWGVKRVVNHAILKSDSRR